MTDLQTYIADDLDIQYPVPADILADHIRSQADDSSCVKAVLLYGSGLWKGDSDDCIWDLHVLVDRFSGFRKSLGLRFAGSILPPNVFFTEIEHQGRILRCKYNVIQINQFTKGCHGKYITPQIWARFAQPCRLVFCCNDKTRQLIFSNIAAAIDSFLCSAFPFVDNDDVSESFWVKGLEQTYADELRSESAARAAQIYAAQKDVFDIRFSLWGKQISTSKKWGRVKRILLRPLRKMVVFIRLMKASMTFENGVDYALWKIKRHSGVDMQATDFQRKYPLIGAWPLLWALYKKGAFK